MATLYVDLGANLIKCAIFCEGKLQFELLPAAIIFRQDGTKFKKVILESTEFLMQEYNSKTDIIAADVSQMINMSYDQYLNKPFYTPLQLDRDAQDNIAIVMGEKRFYAEEIISVVIEYVKEKYSLKLGINITQVTMTINKTQAIALLASTGMTFERQITESAAIASAYLESTSKLKEDLHLIAIDLGFSSLKWHYIRIINGNVVTTVSDTDDTWSANEFTTHLYNYILHKNMYKTDCKNLTKENKVEIESNCEIAKRQLCQEMHYRMSWNCELSRTEFERCISQTIKRIISKTKGFLRKSGVDKRIVSDVILLGGSSNIPEVKIKIEQFFGEGKLHEMNLNPEFIIVYGMAQSV